MRAIITHEMGHALGIKGHCDNPKDIMYWQMQEKSRQIHVPGPFPLFWKSLVKNPSQRDINPLIRLYNAAGPMQRFP
jgi:predicted Zn-dependent protease